MNDPAHELIRRAQAGDRAAAGQLIDDFHGRIYGYHRRLIGDAIDAEDLTQQTFAKAWQSIRAFAGRSTVSSWLHGIAYHVFVDWLRRRKPTEARDEEWWAACPDPFEAFDDLASRDTAAAVWRSVDRLPDDLRQTIHLHYYQELTLQETADALGIAVSTVKHRLQSGIGQLQKLLAEPGLNPAFTKHGS
jgi:RNA polymerase sigma-70 factor (ECF subfamily)